MAIQLPPPETLTAWRALIPARGRLPAAPKRVIGHWSGGGSRANDVDKAHYHLIVNRDATVVSGVHPIAENMRRVSSRVPYAAHTGGFNSFSIGLAMSGMMESALPSAARPAGVPGPAPLTLVQVDAFCVMAALLCDAYDLDPANPAHLFTHAEAWRIHQVKGAQNHTKSDILWLPCYPGLTPEQVGPWLRARAATALLALRA